jgi:hypothetical protein
MNGGVAARRLALDATIAMPLNWTGARVGITSELALRHG